MIYLSIILACICLIQLLYIRSTEKQLKEWLYDLQEIHKNPCQKLFIKKGGLLSEITFKINDILEDKQKEIVQLKKADAANKQILTNLSHDVRTPLTSLTGYLESLKNCLADNPEEYIETAYQKALALKSLIDMIFEWCKISSEEQKYQMIPEDINELTRKVIIDWLPILDKENVSLKTELPDDEWMINIDQMAYKRVINNLIQNAIHHGKCSVIEIQVKMEGDNISIKVSNNGTPIPQEKLPYIFERLYKCDEARSKKGSGLGLAIAKELVLAMGGDINATSDSQRTTFALSFLM